MFDNPLRILLLEDDAAFAKALSASLTRKGHHVSHCTSLTQLEQWLNSGATIDLALFDLKLENETSMNHINILRAAFPNSKIYIITAYASIATTVDAIKNGADDYLPKPITANDIINAYYGKCKAASTTEINQQNISTKRLEWEHIQRRLKENNGNISQTAKQLSMHRRTLQRKLQKKPPRK